MRPAFDGERPDTAVFEQAVNLDEQSRVLFLSDLHFGDGSTMDLFRGQDELLMSYIDQHRADVDVIVFLGDIVDLPQAWRASRDSRL